MMALVYIIPTTVGSYVAALTIGTFGKGKAIFPNFKEA